MGTYQIVREKLCEFIDDDYKKFHSSLVPGLTTMMGVRMPKIREVAKWAAKQNWQSEWELFSNDCYEELMIKGILIGYGKLTKEEQKEYMIRFIPLINNWAICDCCCNTWKFVQKDQEYWWEFLLPYLKSEREYEVRFAVVMMLNYYVEETYIERLFECFDQISHEGYYVKMAIAWALSICYVKYPKKTWRYLERKSLDDFTHNKSIQKIRESYRVSKEEKEKLLKLKVNCDKFLKEA